MSNGEASSEDRTILAAIEALERGTDAPAGTPRGDEAAETMARLYTEVLGLLPYGLEPAEPSPEIRKRLMTAIHGDETQPAVAPMPVAVPPRPSAEVRPPRPVPAAPPVAAVRRRPPRRWPLALAATLCFLLLGLSAWLYLQLDQQHLQLDQQRQTIARLQDELIAERDRAEEASAAASGGQTSERELRANLALMTSRGVQASPMRPAGATPPQPNARGVLFVAADHQHWYLSLEGLQPAEPGKAYKLWFLAEDQTVSAGSFTARPGAPVELSSETMPAGTTGAIVTLEDDPGAAAPTGPEILRTAGAFEIG